VLLLEARDTLGGGARSEPLTLPGFIHDVCSSVHPLALGSPYFRTIGLEDLGVSWLHSPAPLAHVIDEDRAVTLERSIADTAEQLGGDAQAYRRMIEPFAQRFRELCEMALGPLRWPSAPLLLARFGLLGLQSMRGLSSAHFRESAAPALLAGIAAHAMLPLDAAASASFGLLLCAAGHAVGWPLARSGSQSIALALGARFAALGGEVELGRCVRRMTDLPPARAYVFDVTPRQLIDITSGQLPEGYRRKLQSFRYGPGVYKMDWALSEPIPWRRPEPRRAATVHLAGNIDQISAAEAAVHSGRLSERPFVLLVQPSLFDPTRAPRGQHTAWAYCHVPNGSSIDASERIEALIERHAPGFRDVVIARSARDATAMQAYDANYVGGDINGGLADLRQLFFRPTVRLDPYSTPVPRVFICSSSTPPGGGVHGMCGYWASRSVLARAFGRQPESTGDWVRTQAASHGR
jgi:phytoene dehydrogenase-like protein